LAVKSIFALLRVSVVRIASNHLSCMPTLWIPSP
jgi:hypothetical protein